MLRPTKKFENPLEVYWRVLIKRRLTLALFVMSAVGLSWLYTQSLTPRYASNTVLLLEDSAKTLDIKEAAQVSPGWYTTQFEIMSSTTILNRVVEALNLEEQYRTSPGPLATLLGNLSGSSVLNVKPQSGLLIPMLRRSISVSPRLNSNLVDVRVVASDPKLAHDISQSLVETFIDESMSSRIQLSVQATEYLTKRLQKISERIQEKEHELEDFERKEGIPATDVPLETDTRQLAEFSNAYMKAQTDRWELEERLKVLEKVVQEDDFSGITGPGLGDTLDSYSQQLFDARLQLDKLRKQGLLDKHPEVIAARDAIDTVQKRLVFESRAHIAGIRSEIAALKQRERSLEDMTQKLRPGASLERKIRSRHEFLQREIETQKGFYQAYNEQLRRLQLLDDVRSVTVRVVEPATQPDTPFAPNRRLNLIFGLLSGTLLGLTIIFLYDYLDDTLKSSEDVQDYLAHPVVGTIPVISAGERLLPWRLDTQSLVLEAYRSLRTNMQFFETEQPLRTVLVCSAGPGEGKSTTAANIAGTLAQMGKRVCLVDTDMRRPVLHKLFGVANKVGLSSVFTDADLSHLPVCETQYANLTLLPCGPAPPNAAELLASRRMKSLLERLLEVHDHVILDSPPLLMVTDAQLISSLVDGVLIVIRAGETRIGAAQRCIEMLSKAKIVGIVLNRLQLQHSRYYPYYSRYYSRYGGYYRKSGKTDKTDKKRSRDKATAPSAEDVATNADRPS